MTRRHFGNILVASAPVLLISGAKAQDKPEIRITGIPPAEDGNANKTYPIEGEVKGVDFRTHRVVIWSYAGGQWWVQPTVAAPKTPIDTRGSWATETHPGFQYAAALVVSSYTPKSTDAKEPEVGNGVVAVDIVAGQRARNKK